MISVYVLLVTPLIGIFVLAFIGHWHRAGVFNSLFAIVNFAASIWLAINLYHTAPLTSPTSLLYIDSFNLPLIVLTTFIGMTTSIFSNKYMRHEVTIGHISAQQMRLYYPMYQSFLLAMLTALMTNNLGILWVAVEGSTLATVLLVSLYRTPEAVEAAWKYFILCGVGIALALFGTVIVYLAAEQVTPLADNALLWSVLHAHAANMDPGILSIAFIFLLVGYGTKIGLVPLHNWLPDAHSECPTPISALLSGLLLNVALYALLRFKLLIDPALNNRLTGNLMMAFGLLSFLVAAFLLHRQRDTKRLFSYSSVEHMGFMTFAFGLGGPLATFGALLHMIVHSLVKSSIFFTAGFAIQIAGSKSLEKIRGLIRTQPVLGWTLLIAAAAISGIPPFGVFTSEFLVLMATVDQETWLIIPLLIGLVVAFAGLFRFVQPMVYGEMPDQQTTIALTSWPAITHLTLVLLLGLFIPAVLVHFLSQATLFIAGATP